MSKVELGLKANRVQFSLLVLLNAFVGGMVGLERTILPRIAEADFHIAAKTAILSFIIVFGIIKAFTNFFTGALANRLGRRNLLIAGWLFGAPVPFLLMMADSWNVVILANVLLGINQGLAWSTTVMMKIDLVGERERGLAMGLNEFAGYLAVAAVAFVTGWIASAYGLRPYPFYTGVLLVLAGLFMSIFLIRDTHAHVAAETAASAVPRLGNIFWQTTLFNRNLASVTQAGLVNNLNDGMVWGLLPILLAEKKFGLAEIGLVTATYPAVWGIGQLFTGRMSDFFCKKSMLVWGMCLQGIALLMMIWASSLSFFLALAALLGWGTAMVYPTFLASIAENTHPLDRPKSLGAFRFWRDLGYAFGAAITGLLADLFSLSVPLLIIALLTVFSAVSVELRMRCQTSSIKILAWLRQKVRAIFKSDNRNQHTLPSHENTFRSA
jgi:MFS family permease